MKLFTHFGSCFLKLHDVSASQLEVLEQFPLKMPDDPKRINNFTLQDVSLSRSCWSHMFQCRCFSANFHVNYVDYWIPFYTKQVAWYVVNRLDWMYIHHIDKRKG